MRRKLIFWSGAAITLASAMLWLASYAMVSYRSMSPGRDWTAALWHGELWVTTGGTYCGPGLCAIHPMPRVEYLSRTAWWPRESWFQVRNYASGSSWDLHVPLWTFLVLGLAFWGTAAPGWLRARRAARALKFGTCRECRYDLTGIRGRCPECGAVSQI